ncbi:ABC transporter permease [Pseudoalteromonas sp. T1lg65]|uniref:ABC transporter permease n=1 Tax=Pseudoalteromonas sp. T1lg65 TaxID=2077101 RepID=UPI003F799121
MISYNFTLALRSLRERWQLTLMMVCAIAVGIGILITIQTIAYNQAKPPLPGKAERVALVQLDHRDVNASDISELRRRPGLTYKDANNIINGEFTAERQTLAWPSNNILSLNNQEVNPIQSDSVATNRHYFSIFDLEFLFGGHWQEEDDKSGSPVIVLSEQANNQLFGGQNSVGKQLNIDGKSVTVVGVTKTVYESRRYQLGDFFPTNPNSAFVPSSFALNNNLNRWVYMQCHQKDSARGRTFVTQNANELMNSECGFIKLWAELASADDMDIYQQEIDQYVDQQYALGRFQRGEENYVTSLLGVNQYWQNFFKGRDQLRIIAPLFFFICILNAVGLLLAKFTRQTFEISLRRALGASKKVLITQFTIEILLVGMIGGLLGVAISFFGLKFMLWQQLYAVDFEVAAEVIASSFSLDWFMVGQAMLMSLLASVVMGMYPILRTINIAPAPQLKSQ